VEGFAPAITAQGTKASPAVDRALAEGPQHLPLVVNDGLMVILSSHFDGRLKSESGNSKLEAANWERSGSMAGYPSVSNFPVSNFRFLVTSLSSSLRGGVKRPFAAPSRHPEPVAHEHDHLLADKEHGQ
jgi:hypothetical protein